MIVHQVQQSVGLVSIVVRDYDEALAFYVGMLGFVLVEDSFVEAQNKRWVVVSPPGATVREPKEEPYGTVAVFKDLYGNLWDLLEPRSHDGPSADA